MRLTHGSGNTVAFLIDWLGTEYHAQLFAGATEAAQERGVNLLTFVGHEFDDAELSTPHNAVYRVVAGRRVSGVVASSHSLMAKVGTEVGSALLSGFSTQLCSIGFELPGASTVLVDNVQGVTDVCHHLVDTHQRRAFGVIAGPPGNPEARVRKRAAIDALRQRGIELDARRIVDAGFSDEQGTEAVIELLDRRRIQPQSLDALVCANDAVAVAVVEALRARNVRVPGDIAVVGFDDLETSRYVSPPLTTVSQPVKNVGREAVRLLCDRLDGPATPRDLRLSASMVLRRSCGCSGFEVTPHLRDDGLGRLGIEAELIRRRDRIGSLLSSCARGRLGPVGSGWESRMLTSVAGNLSNADVPAFLPFLDGALQKLIDSGEDVAVVHDVLTALRGEVLAACGVADTRITAENLFHEARLLASRAIEQAQVLRRLDTKATARLIKAVGEELVYHVGEPTFFQALRQQLPRLHVRRAFVSTFEPGNPRRLRHVYGFTEHEVIPGDDALFPSNDIAHAAAFSDTTGFSYLVMPLTRNERALGILVVEVPAVAVEAYETVRTSVSAAIHQLAKQSS